MDALERANALYEQHGLGRARRRHRDAVPDPQLEVRQQAPLPGALNSISTRHSTRSPGRLDRLTNRTKQAHDHASGTQADHLGRPAVLPRHRLRRRGQLPPEHLCRAPRMARPLRRLGAVRGRRHGRVLLADPRRLLERGAHRRRDLQGQGTDPGRRRRPHPRGHRIRQGSAAPGRQRRAADAALPDRSLAGRHRRSRPSRSARPCRTSA